MLTSSPPLTQTRPQIDNTSPASFNLSPSTDAATGATPLGSAGGLLVASANGSSVTFATSHRSLLADLKKDAAGIGFDILDWGQSALNKLGLNAQLSPQQRVGLLTKVYEETLQRFELGDPQVQRKDLTALHQALNREITAVKTGQARAMTTFWEVGADLLRLTRQASVGLTAGMAAVIGGPAAGALAGGFQSLVTLAAMTGSAVAQGQSLESLNLPQEALNDVGNVFTTLAGAPLLKLFGLPGAPTGPGVRALIAHAARQGTFDAILDGAVTTVGEAVANKQPIPEALRAGAVQGVTSFLFSGTINGALGRLAAKQHTAMANTIKAMTRDEASAAVSKMDAATVARLREDAPMVYQALNQKTGGALDAKGKAAGGVSPAKAGGAGGRAAPVKAGGDVLPSNTAQSANALLAEANGPIGLGSRAGTSGSGSTAGALPGGGTFGFGGNLVQFTAFPPLLNGKKPTEFGTHADAMTAAVRYNGASEGDVAVPLLLAFKDDQGNTINRSVVYEGVAPGRVGELVSFFQKNESYQVLNATTVLAEAGLSQKGIDARIARQSGTAQQPDATGTPDAAAATANAGTAAAPAIRVGSDGVISGIPGMPEGVTARLVDNGGGQDLRLEAMAPDGHTVTATISSSSGPITELPAGFVETAQLFKQKVGSRELKPRAETAGTPAASVDIGNFLTAWGFGIPNAPSKAPDSQAVKLADDIAARKPEELALTSPRILTNLLDQFGEQIRAANPADPGTAKLRAGYDHLLGHLRKEAAVSVDAAIQKAGSYETWFAQQFGPEGRDLANVAKLPRPEQEAVLVKLANEKLLIGTNRDAIAKFLSAVRDNPSETSKRLERALLFTADVRPLAADWGSKEVDERLATLGEAVNLYNQRNGTTASLDFVTASDQFGWLDGIVNAMYDINTDRILVSSSKLRNDSYGRATSILGHELDHAYNVTALNRDLSDGQIDTGANALTSLNQNHYQQFHGLGLRYQTQTEEWRAHLSQRNVFAGDPQGMQQAPWTSIVSALHPLERWFPDGVPPIRQDVGVGHALGTAAPGTHKVTDNALRRDVNAMLRGLGEAGKGAAPGSREANAATVARSLLVDLNMFGTDKSVIAAFGPDGKPVGAASYRVDSKGVLNVENLVTLPGSGTGESLMQELFARAPNQRMSATATDDTRGLFAGLGGVENPPGVFTWTKTPARTGPSDGVAARLPVPGDDPFGTNFDELDDAFGGPPLDEESDLLTDLFGDVRFDENTGFNQDAAPPPLTGPASRVVSDPAALAQMEARLRASFDGPVSFIQDSRVTDPGSVVITLSEDRKTVEIRHGGGVDPELMNTLEIAGKLGGAPYIQDIFALQGSPEQITKDAARLMRPLSLLGPTGTADEFGLVILGDGEKGWVHPAIALKADGSVQINQALNVGTIKNPKAITESVELHPHKLGYNSLPLYSPDGLSEADLRYADVAYRVYTGRETEGELGTLAEQKGRFPNLEKLTVVSVSDLNMNAETRVFGDADGTTVQSDVEVSAVVSGVPFPDRYFDGLTRREVAPRPGESTFDVNALMDDANAASGLPAALTRAADGLINDRLPVTGTGAGMITSLQRLGTELPNLHDLWNGIPVTADPTTTLAHLDLKTMQLTIRTPDGDSVLSPNFTPAAPNTRQREILNAGASDPRYLDTVRELLGAQPGTTPATGPQTGLGSTGGALPEARLPSAGDVLRMTGDEIAALPAGQLRALRESFGQQLAAATGAKTPAPDLANAYSRVLGTQITQADAALGDAPLDQILRRYAPTGEPDWKQKLGELSLEERYAVLGRVAQDPKRFSTSPEVAGVRGLLSTLPPDPAFLNVDIGRLRKLDAALRADPMIADALANWDKLSPEQQTAALQTVARHTAESFGLPEPKLEIGAMKEGRAGGYRLQTDDTAALSGAAPIIRLTPDDPLQPAGFKRKAGDIVHELMHALQDRNAIFRRLGQIAPGDIDHTSSIVFGANLLPRVYTPMPGASAPTDSKQFQEYLHQQVEEHAHGIQASFQRLLDQHPAASGEPPLRVPGGAALMMRPAADVSNAIEILDVTRKAASMSPGELAGECGTLAVEAVAQLRAKRIRASSELGFNGSHAYVVIPTKSDTGELRELVFDPSIRQFGGADNLLGGKAYFLGTREEHAVIMSQLTARHYLP